jgi:hypothetical protein
MNYKLMNNFSYCFIILVILIYNISNIKINNWNEQFSNYFKINNKKIYSIEKKNKTSIFIYSNYKYSLEYKFAFEFSKLYPIINIESNSLTNNLNKLSQTIDNNVYMCYEQDYYDYFKRNLINNDIRYICSLYYVELYLIVKDNIPIKKIKDINVYPEYYKIKKDLGNTLNLPEKLVIGIPNDYDNYNLNADKFFNILGLNKSNFIFVYEKEKELFTRMKQNNNKTIHIIFNISSYKNPYLLEFLRTKNARIIGLEDSNFNLLKLNFSGCFKSELNISKYISNNRYSKLDNLVKNKNKVIVDTVSFRICLLCHKNVDNNFIYNLLKKLYGNLDKLRYNLNNYIYINNNNLSDILDPYHMFYLKKNKGKYHDGAYNFFREMNFIKDEVKNDLYIQDEELYN